MKNIALIVALAALPVLPVSAQVFAPEPVEAGWERKDLSTDEIDGTLRITWTVSTGLGSLVVVCGAWASDVPDLHPHAAAALAKSSASEGGRVLLSSLSHFAQAPDLDALEGTAAPCARTTATRAGAVSVDIYEGEVLVPAPPKKDAAETDDAAASTAPAEDTGADDGNTSENGSDPAPE